MSAYSQFMEMSLASERETVEIVLFCGGFEYSGRMVEVLDLGELHGELWCDLMDSPEDEMTGEIRMNGKTVLRMRKFGETIS